MPSEIVWPFNLLQSIYVYSIFGRINQTVNMYPPIVFDVTIEHYPLRP